MSPSRGRSKRTTSDSHAGSAANRSRAYSGDGGVRRRPLVPQPTVDLDVFRHGTILP